VTSAGQPAKPAAKKQRPSVQKKAGAVPQPRGRPPVGKSWDGEAGGWVTSAGQPAKPAAKKQRPSVQKAAAAPAAAAAASASVVGAIPQPRGRPPLGESWDSEAGRWVTGAAQPAKPAAKNKKAAAAAPAASAAGAIAQPRGRPPAGKSWDGEAGRWVTGAGIRPPPSPEFSGSKAPAAFRSLRGTVGLPRAAPGRLAGSRVRRAELKSTSPPWVQRPAEDVPDAQAGAFRPPPKAGFSLVSPPFSSAVRQCREASVLFGSVRFCRGLCSV
jgi:hypothetical protein